MSGFFKRSSLNTTFFDTHSSPDAKQVHWTLELIFYRQTSKPSPPAAQFSLSRHCTDPLALIVLNQGNMILEEHLLSSFLSRPHLKKTFYNEQFSLLLSELTDSQVAEAHVYIKKIVQSNDAAATAGSAMEDGEIEGTGLCSYSKRVVRPR